MSNYLAFHDISNIFELFSHDPGDTKNLQLSFDI